MGRVPLASEDPTRGRAAGAAGSEPGHGSLACMSGRPMPPIVRAQDAESGPGAPVVASVPAARPRPHAVLPALEIHLQGDRRANLPGHGLMRTGCLVEPEARRAVVGAKLESDGPAGPEMDARSDPPLQLPGVRGP